MFRSVIGLAALSVAVQPSPQTQSPAPPTVWNLDWQLPHCRISTGSPETIGLSLWMTPGDPDPAIYLIGSRDALPEIGKYTVTVALAPSGETFQASVFERGVGQKRRIVILSRLRDKFPAAFAKAD